MRAFLIVCLVAASVMADSQSVRNSKRGGAKKYKKSYTCDEAVRSYRDRQKGVPKKGQTDLCVGKLKYQPCRTVFFSLNNETLNIRYI